MTAAAALALLLAFPGADMPAIAPGSILAQAPAETPSPSSSPPVTQEPPEEDEPEAKPVEPSPVAAAGWCTVKKSSEEEPEADEDEAPAQGCDAGIGIALYRLKRLALVGVVGSKTLGGGIGWIIGRPAGRTLAVAVGMVCSWSSEGIDGDDCRPAIGATLALTRAGQ